MSAPEYIKKAKDLRSRGHLDEALIAARHAVSLDVGDADAHWQVAVCLVQLKERAKSLEPLEKVTELAPEFAPGWSQLGLTLQDQKQLERAKKCFERAIELDRQNLDALVELAKIYEANKEPTKEKRVLLALDGVVDLNSHHLNRLGILFYGEKNYYDAIRYFRRVTTVSPAAYGFFNLGLAFNRPEVNQRVDAIDAWRRALGRDASYEDAQANVDKLLPKFIELRRRLGARRSPTLDRRNWYADYINPYELLRLDPTLEGGPDAKEILYARKLLLQEIDLEDGRISWKEGLVLDRSRAIAVSEQLNDPRLAQYHRHVFRNQELSGFLQTGTLEHFLVDEASSPIELIELIEADDDGLATWLSPRFAAQFDLVLTEAIEQKDALSVECLLGGRRWTRPEDEEKCFEGAHRQLEKLLDPLKRAAEQAEKSEPTLKSVETVLEEGKLAEILSLLPVAFYGEQQEAAGLIRRISLSAHNIHSDPDLAKAVLKLSTRFTALSPALQHRIEEDLSTLDERIKEERKDEAHLTFGPRRCVVGKEGVRLGEAFIRTKEVLSVRGGVIATNNSPLTLKFLIAVGSSKGAEIKIEWSASQSLDEQKKHFLTLMNAAETYLLPNVIREIRQDLDNNQKVRIGGVGITRDGVELESKGWFTSKVVHCPWSRLSAEIANGAVVVVDRTDPKTKVSLPLYTVDNALVLHFLAHSA